MSDELKKNYEILKTDNQDYPYLVLRRFCHSIEQQNQGVVEELNAMKYQGWVLFDQIFKGGNTKTRYTKQMFDHEFYGPMLRVDIEIDHPIRIMVSNYLRDNHYVEGTSLTDQDIQTIKDGGVI